MSFIRFNGHLLFLHDLSLSRPVKKHRYRDAIIIVTIITEESIRSSLIINIRNRIFVGNANMKRWLAERFEATKDLPSLIMTTNKITLWYCQQSHCSWSACRVDPAVHVQVFLSSFPSFILSTVVIVFCTAQYLVFYRHRNNSCDSSCQTYNVNMFTF